MLSRLGPPGPAIQTHRDVQNANATSGYIQQAKQSLVFERVYTVL